MQFIQFFITVFFSLFIVVDVFANLPIFISLTGGYSEEERKTVAKNAMWIAFFTLLIFTLFGRFLFSLLHIQMYSFEIAGGILLLIVAIEMLFGRKTRTEFSETESLRREERENITIVPLAIPLHTGPAAITTAMVLYEDAKSISLRLTFFIAIIFVFLLSLWILHNSNLILKVLRPTGTKVITRIMGLLLSAIAIQFIANGVIFLVGVARS